ISLGYNIGCKHSKTMARSSLGARAESLRVQFFVGAFHGYAHNCRCQLGFHPQFLATTGLKDFETNKQISLKQNLTIHLFQHGSAYHRHMCLHFFWSRWDEG
ncbi:hypothetical protein DACRYDRAFT_49530, partial [Dacryopinax primogenitus]